MLAADFTIPILIPIPLILGAVWWVLSLATKPKRDREHRQAEQRLAERPRSENDW